MFVYLLQGDFAGQCLHVADTNAAAGVTDGWAYDLTGQPYPYDLPAFPDTHEEIPASYDAWVDAGHPAVDAEPTPEPAPEPKPEPEPDTGEPGPVVSAEFAFITNANPAVIQFSVVGARKFKNGDVVTITDTGSAKVDDTNQTLANGDDGGRFELSGLDLSGGSAIGTGTATLVQS